MGPVVQVESVSKSFGVKVIDDVSLTVERGDAIGIVGPNGAGKTTLLNLIAGDLSPDSGQVLLDGVDVTRTKPDHRCRAGIGRTYQIPRPFEGLTVFENVLVGSTFGRRVRLDRGQRVESACESLRRTGLLEKANVPASELTLLERKRLELARALGTGPTVLLLDEIAGGLTEAEVLELVDLVKQIHASGTTIVWIEHIVHALLAVVDRVVAIAWGRKLAEGEPSVVMNSPEVREVYLGSVER